MDRKLAKFCTTLLVAVWGYLAMPGAVAAVDCQPLVVAKEQLIPPPKHAKGLLWKVARPGHEPSYLFGTMHVGDEEIVNLPPQVGKVFDSSDSLVVEATMDGSSALEFSRLMFYEDGTLLRDLIGSELFDMTATLLARYGIPTEAAMVIKPWAVFLTLSMPPPQGRLPLDMVLTLRAQARGAPVHGLETLREQADLVSGLPIGDQIELVKETVCNYDLLQADLREMKRMYLARDLGGLMAMTDKYEMTSERRYRWLTEELLWKRNERMARRMAPRLAEGNSFIAIGALHLPGKRGLLSLLEAEGYEVSPVY
jgi:uncharacterized protein YbaP (TraB family)